MQHGDLLPWSIEKLNTLKSCGLKFWLQYITQNRDLVARVNITLPKLMSTVLTNALIINDRSLIIQGLELQRKKFELLGYAPDVFVVGLHNLYDRIQNLIRKLPEAVLFPNLQFAVDLEGNSYDWFNPNAFFRTKFDVAIEYTVGHLKERRKAYRVIDFHYGKIYQTKTEKLLDIKATCLKLARGSGIYTLEYQIALITEIPALRDVVLTPIKKRAIRRMKAQTLVDYVEEFQHLIPDNLAKLSYEKKYLASRNCSGCPFTGYCHK